MSRVVSRNKLDNALDELFVLNDFVVFTGVRSAVLCYLYCTVPLVAYLVVGDLVVRY